MMARTRHYGGTPSPHDTTGPRSKWDMQRPMGAPPPEGGGGGRKSSCAVLALGFGAGSLAWLAAASTLAGRWAS